MAQIMYRPDSKKKLRWNVELCFIICFVSHTSMAHYHLIGLMLWYALFTKNQEI